jgi:hypothetical protein
MLLRRGDNSRVRSVAGRTHCAVPSFAKGGRLYLRPLALLPRLGTATGVEDGYRLEFVSGSAVVMYTTEGVFELVHCDVTVT